MFVKFVTVYKNINCSFVNCKEFYKHERLFMIIIQQVPKRRNIGLKLSEYVCQFSTPRWNFLPKTSSFKVLKHLEIVILHEMHLVMLLFYFVSVSANIDAISFFTNMK